MLPKFEGFPLKKLESLRVAAALYLKLKGILNDLQNWKVELPLEQLLNKVESYFDKVNSFSLLWQHILTVNDCRHDNIMMLNRSKAIWK